MKKVSIIVPVYNVELQLKKCISSLIDQSYKNIEIILINDGSTDSCPDICDNYAKIDNRINVIHKINEGAASARNVGIDKSTGEFICFVDSDDWCDREMIKYLLSVADKNDIVSSEYVFTKEENYKIAHQDIKIKEFNKTEAIESLLYQKEIENGPCAKLYSRSIIAGIRFPDEIKIGEDLLFNYNVINNAKNITHSNAKKYFYYQRSGSAMKSVFKPGRMDAITASERILGDIKNNLPHLVRAGERRLFIAAVRTMLTMDNKSIKKEHSVYYKICKEIIKRNAISVLLNSKIEMSEKVFAIFALINPALIFHISYVKKNIKKYAQN